MSKKMAKKGFTLLEILLVVGIIAILAGIVILAINPTKQLGDTRNAQRRADVLTILNAVYQYSIDNNGTVPAEITGTDGVCGTSTTYANVIATSTATTSSALVSLQTALVGSSAKYVVSIPKDPLAVDTSGYNITKTPTGRVTVCAPLAERDDEIMVTR